MAATRAGRRPSLTFGTASIRGIDGEIQAARFLINCRINTPFSMSDPLRTDLSRATGGSRGPGDPGQGDVSDADREAKIEQLLLAGLDHYFAAQYEQAIHVWTRVLFLDRTHAKGRAYIERARSALAERQRESDEALQKGLAAYRRGDTDEARQLLQSAVNAGGPAEEALSLLDRLDRADPTAPGFRRTATPRQRPAAPDTGTSGSRWPLLVWALAASVLIGGIAIVAPGVNWRSVVAGRTAPVPLLLTAPDNRLPLPRNGEIALSRARALSESGHHREALTALASVRPTDPERPEADQLQARIQRDLIALTKHDDVHGVDAVAAGNGRQGTPP